MGGMLADNHVSAKTAPTVLEEMLQGPDKEKLERGPLIQKKDENGAGSPHNLLVLHPA